jgi:antitoxin component YwqK of YwqJK toxin-antitoxin module
MKKMLAVLIAIGFYASVSAQQLNNQGLYEEKDGTLFTGNITSTQNDVKCLLTVRSGIVDGPAKYFSSDGELLESGNFKGGHKHDKWTRYTSKGSISAIAFYNLGKKDGKWLVFDDNGKKRFELNYDNGAKIGVWTNWDENGNVTDFKDYSKLN